MALVFLVRHAQASFGTHDYDRLSELGRQQSRWLGEYFAERGVRFSRVVAGSLKRQQDTAREILDVLGQDSGLILTHEGLNEYHGEKLYAAYTQGADPVAHQKSDYRGYWKTFRAAMLAWAKDELPGMPETWGEFAQRMRAGLGHGCAGLARDEVALVVSSGGAIGRIVSDLTGANAASAIEFNLQFRNTGFCELLAIGDELRLTSLNNIPHLERADRRKSITFA
ncbi:MAG: histidine phosphatase family protein [Burkholderiaceae bacterium]